MPKTVDDFRREMTANPIKAAETLQSEMAGVRAALHARLAEAFLLADHFWESPADWDRFRAHGFWNGAPPKDYLVGVMRFVNRAATSQGARYNCAIRHATALQPYFNRKSSVYDVRTALKTSGVEALYRSAVEGKIRSAPGVPQADLKTLAHSLTADSPSGGDGTDLSNSKGGGPVQRCKAMTRLATTTGLGNKKFGHARKYGRKWCEARFVVEAPTDLLHICIGLPDEEEIILQFPNGTQASIRKKTVDDDGFLNFSMSRSYVSHVADPAKRRSPQATRL